MLRTSGYPTTGKSSAKTWDETHRAVKSIGSRQIESTENVPGSGLVKSTESQCTKSLVLHWEAWREEEGRRRERIRSKEREREGEASLSVSLTLSIDYRSRSTVAEEKEKVLWRVEKGKVYERMSSFPFLAFLFSPFSETWSIPLLLLLQMGEKVPVCFHRDRSTFTVTLLRNYEKRRMLSSFCIISRLSDWWDSRGNGESADYSKPFLNIWSMRQKRWIRRAERGLHWGLKSGLVDDTKSERGMANGDSRKLDI